MTSINSTEDETSLKLTDEDQYILNGEGEAAYKISVSSFNESYCFYRSLLHLKFEKKLTYIAIKSRSNRNM